MSLVPLPLPLSYWFLGAPTAGLQLPHVSEGRPESVTWLSREFTLLPWAQLTQYLEDMGVSKAPAPLLGWDGVSRPPWDSPLT